MSKKIKIYDLIGNIKTEMPINKLFKVLPTSIVKKLMDVSYYMKYEKFKFHKTKRKISQENGHANEIIRIIQFLKMLEDAYVKNCHNKVDYLYNVHLHAKSIEKIFTHDYKIYLDLLSDMNIVTRRETSKYCGGGYHNGVKKEKFTYTYDISPELIDGDDLLNPQFSLIFIEDSANKYDLEANSILKYESFDEGLIKRIDPRMINTLKYIQLNKVNAIMAELNYFDTKKHSIKGLADRLSAIIRFGEKKYLTKGKKVNRLYHHLTNLSSVARKHFNIKFYNVDLTNSQPLILAYYLIKNGFEIDENYVDNVQQGKFYESLMDKENFDRKIIKESVYQFLFFGFWQENDINKNFKAIYPKIWQHLKELSDKKASDERAKKTTITLASILQNMETEIFETTPSICANSTFLFTLHDSIYFDNYDDTVLVVRHLEEKFKEMDLEAKFNFE